MRKFDLSCMAPLALSAAGSLVLSFIVAGAIATQGMKSVAALKSVPAVTQPLLAQSQEAHIGPDQSVLRGAASQPEVM